MRIRGRRRCRDCGRTWSYYETGSVECPECGSVASVGTDEERRLHTDAPATFDLTPVRAAIDERPLRELAAEAASLAREYRRGRGFVSGGELLALDDTYLAATELAHVGSVAGRSLETTDAVEWYLLALLRGADGGERPAAADVPPELAPVRGLAAADAVDDYRRDVREWLGDDPSPAVGDDIERLDAHVRRVRALGGAVEPATADRLVAAARELGEYLRTDRPDALESARGRLDHLG